MDIILKYFPNLTETQKEQFSKLQDLYSDWNSKINVISRKDIEELYLKHILHALGIAKVISFKPKTSILDVGTGGGIPGIPLAIMFPECDFYLVDSIGKKIKVVNAIASELGLKNLKAEQKRAEEVKEKFDFVISRAVTALPRFMPWIRNKFKPQSFNDLKNGVLYLKGGDISEELEPLREIWREFMLNDYYEEEFFETKKVVHLY